MSSHIIDAYEADMLRSDVPDFQPGDTVRVSLKIIEGDKERLQDFEGLCIRRKGGGIRETVTLRKVTYGVGMERIIPIHSPKVSKIQVTRHGKVRRAKLYYLRDLRGKKARIVERKNPDGTPMRVTQTSGKKVAPLPATSIPEVTPVLASNEGLNQERAQVTPAVSEVSPSNATDSAQSTT